LTNIADMSHELTSKYKYTYKYKYVSIKYEYEYRYSQVQLWHTKYTNMW